MADEKRGEADLAALLADLRDFRLAGRHILIRLENKKPYRWSRLISEDVEVACDAVGLLIEGIEEEAKCRQS